MKYLTASNSGRSLATIALGLSVIMALPSVALGIPSVRLETKYTSRSNKLVVQLLPDSSAASCNYELHGSLNARRLRGTLTSATKLLDLSGTDGLVAAAATRLNKVKTPATRSSATSSRFNFVATLNCAGEIVRSNTTRISVPFLRSGRTSVQSRWLKHLTNRMALRGLEIEHAFPSLAFDRPVDLQNAGDGTNRLFIVEQTGAIKVFSNDQAATTATEFLDLSSKVATVGEQGLLGLAFHPRYKTNRFFFVNYTRAGDGATVIARYRADAADPNRADPNSELVMLTFAQPFTNHNGGQVVFGPDGFLYISSGDGGGNASANGQSRTTLLGKILRIDVDNPGNGRNYGIPAANPYAGNTQGSREEIFAYGFRNPWRISFDSDNGRLWAADVGQNEREEIDIVTRGANYGWNTMEGTQCFGSSSCDQTGLTLPIFDYSHALGESITGGFVYRGTENPGLSGLYVYGDFISGRTWALQLNGSSAKNSLLFDTAINISSFGVDENKELYVLSYSDGRIYRFKSVTG